MTIKFKKTVYVAYLLSLCIGIFLYFIYELSHYNRVVGLITPINESPWEQMKLLFFPYLPFTIILHFFSKRNSKKILFASAISIVIGIILSISSYYTIHGAFGIKTSIIDIFIYVTCLAVSYILCYHFIKNNTFPQNNIIGFTIFVVLFLLFILFTFLPPRVPLFQDSTTKSFGLIHETYY